MKRKLTLIRPGIKRFNYWTRALDWVSKQKIPQNWALYTTIYKEDGSAKVRWGPESFTRKAWKRD